MTAIPTAEAGQVRAWATIDLSALQHNLQRVRELRPGSKIVAVIKANAYGHGSTEVAQAICAMPDAADCLAVATIDELLALQLLGTGKRLLLLSGFRTAEELRFLVESGVEFEIHADYQLELLKNWLRSNPHPSFAVWLSVDTGMHRLGFSPPDFAAALEFLCNCKKLRSLVIMSHLACADAADSKSVVITGRQIAQFSELVNSARSLRDARLEASLAASAGILGRSDLNFDYVRPGIMLYGGSPFASREAKALGLRPVMTLQSRLIAINDVAAGESVGYGATFTCSRDSRVGVVAIGYGDGYPRAAANGTPVVVHTSAGARQTGLLGRVSMDMITIDLTDLPDAQVGDAVELWGNNLPVDVVARSAGTISYELCCHVNRRVKFYYQQG